MNANDTIAILGLQAGQISLANSQPLLAEGVTLNTAQTLLLGALNHMDCATSTSAAEELEALQSALLSEAVTGWLLQCAVEQEALALTPPQSSASLRTYRQAVRALNDGIDPETWTWADFSAPVPGFTLA